jgi:DnaJ homolog subfamily C member 3
MTALKHCLHFDPDSKPCLSAHRLIKSFEKSIVSLDTAMEREDWRAVITLIMGKDKSKPLGNGLLAKFEEALEAHTAPALLHSSPTTSDRIPMPSAQKKSPRRAELLRVICRAFTYIENPRAGERWCDALLAMDGFADDVDGLVGKGEAALKKEQWEEAVKFLESAWESSERSNRQVSGPS